jgi:hypothetical protein
MERAEAQATESFEEQADDIASLGSPLNWEAASRGLIVLVALALAWYTWARWGDIQVDTGRELYVPAEILRGKLLYRDIWYPYGPLAAYAEATLLFVFGHSLNALYVFGLAIAIGCALLFLEIGTMLAGRAVGLTGALALLFVGFDPNFANYPLAYSYAATIGLALSLTSALFTLRHVFDRPGYNLLLAGLAAGLALLSKLEFGVASYLMLGLVLVAEAARQRSARPLLRGIAACAPGVALCVAIYGWFFWTLTPAFMMNANWLGMPGTSGKAYTDHLYARVGQRFIPREMLALTVLAGVCLALWFLLAKANRWLRSVALAIMIAILMLYRFDPANPAIGAAFKALTGVLVFPLGMFFIGCGFLAYTIYEQIQSADRHHLAQTAFCVFALLLAIRVLAGIVPWGYSIYYAMPLFLVFIIAISRCIRAAMPSLSVDRQERLLNDFLVAEVVMLALVCIPQSNQRPATLRTSWGIIHLEPEEASVAEKILTFISDQERLGRRVAILPEAPIFYAFTGTEAPSRWYTLVPGMVSAAQEDEYISDLKRAAPDYILLTSRKTSEYGADYFGIDYNQKIYNWVESNYSVVGQFGRFRRDSTGSTTAALLYQRRALAGANQEEPRVWNQ